MRFLLDILYLHILFTSLNYSFLILLNKLVHILWLKTTEIYSLKVLEVRSSKLIFRVVLHLNTRENLFPCHFQILETIDIFMLMASFSIFKVWSLPSTSVSVIWSSFFDPCLCLIRSLVII